MPKTPVVTYAVEQIFEPVEAHQVITSLAAAHTLTAPPDASVLLVQAFGQAVRFTLDGTTPTATTGFQLAAGDAPLLLPISPCSRVRLIEEAAGATLQYQWGK